jgi:RNA polymerase sigma-B factor
MTPSTALPSRRGLPIDASLSTEELLRRRDRLPAQHPDRARLRARAIERNLPMAANLARRYAGRGEHLDDLAQVAAVALITAVDRYDSRRQVPFAGFAIPSILGGLKRHFRDTAWAMRVPRATQQLALRVPKVTHELSQQMGHTPTNADLADHLHVSVDDVLAAVDAWQKYHLQSLNTPATPTDNDDFIDVIGGIDPGYARVEDRLFFQPLLAELSLRERRILTMRFHDHMNQSQIAAEVGLSHMHVSRLLRQTLARLRAAMPAELTPACRNGASTTDRLGPASRRGLPGVVVAAAFGDAGVRGAASVPEVEEQDQPGYAGEHEDPADHT